MKIVRSPYLVAFIIVTIIFISLPLNIPRHNLSEEVLPHYFREPETDYFTPDLDGDGKSEIVRFKTNLLGKPAFVIENENYSSLHQANFNGIIDPTDRTVIFADMENDGHKEICFLNYRHDSMFVKIYRSFSDTDSLSHSEIFIDNLKLPREGQFGSQDLADIVDLDGDGLKEIIVTLRAGFEIHPRGLYIYNQKLDTVFSIPKQALDIRYMYSFDIDNDGQKEIFVTSKAVMNLPASDSLGYNDYDAVFNVYTNRAEIKYKTDILMRGNYAGVISLPVIIKDDTCALAVCYSSDKSTTLIKVNSNLTLDTIDIIGGKNANPGLDWYMLNNSAEYLVKDNLGNFYSFGKAGYLEKLKNPYGYISYEKSFNLSSDSKPEHIVLKANQEFAVLDSKFRMSNWVSSPIPTSDISPLRFQEFLTIEGPKLFLQTEKTIQLFDYSINPKYLLRYPGLLMVYLLTVSLIYLIRFQQKRNWEKQQKIKEEIQVLQYRAINNQLNPHFSFNMLNVIGYSILNEDKEKAYQLLTQYSKLTRDLVESSHHITTTLEDEIKFVDTYLQLQKIRFEDGLACTIDVDPIIDQKMLIPKMMIHTFAENSIKHGLSKLESSKELNITIRSSNPGVNIEITDNGLGYNNAHSSQIRSTGRGLDILNQIFDLFRKLTGTNVTYDIQNNEDFGKAGTTVLIHIQ
jgi:hypothetical protein